MKKKKKSKPTNLRVFHPLTQCFMPPLLQLLLYNLSKQSNFIIILNTTEIFALKKANNLTWSMAFSYIYIFGSFMGMISLVNFEFEVGKEL